MAIIGLDDTDSRTEGMCTTFVATRLAERIEATGGSVARTLLIRLNPAVEHKTRGNAALAIHCDLPADEALALAQEVFEMAVTDDPQTNPGVVVADCEPTAVPDAVAEHARTALQALIDVERARTLLAETGFDAAAAGTEQGLVGALAAVGAWRAFDEWTSEHIAYREADRWGRERTVDADSVSAAADRHYPRVWDTVDRATGYPVCVPRTPCPILYGIRGDDPAACERAAAEIESEPVARTRTFLTNQGTDAHLQSAPLDQVTHGGAYRTDGTVQRAPETRQGGHVFFELGDGDAAIDCVAFEPTKRFRDHVRALRAGDSVTVCGEVSDGTLKLEKFALRDPIESERVPPTCPDCERSMSSAGRDQGYRCRECGTHRNGKVERAIDRDLEPGWYEVPPVARRHVAKPLIRGGFDGPTHPER